MKLRNWDRILLFVGAFLTAVLGVGIFLINFRINGLVFTTFGGGNFVINKLTIILCAAYLFIYAIYVMSVSLGSRRKKAEFVVQQASGGEMRISVHAMDSLIRKVMAAHTEMTLKDMAVEIVKDNVFVDLKIAIAGNVSIPLAVASVQKDIRQHLLSSTGIDVKEVRVSVDTTDAAVEASPFIMHEADSTVTPEDEGQQEIKKKHRLFSKKSDTSHEADLLDRGADKYIVSDDHLTSDLRSVQQEEGKDQHAGT